MAKTLFAQRLNVFLAWTFSHIEPKKIEVNFVSLPSFHQKQIYLHHIRPLSEQISEENASIAIWYFWIINQKRPDKKEIFCFCQCFFVFFRLLNINFGNVNAETTLMLLRNSKNTHVFFGMIFERESILTATVLVLSV